MVNKRLIVGLTLVTVAAGISLILPKRQAQLPVPAKEGGGGFVPEAVPFEEVAPREDNAPALSMPKEKERPVAKITERIEEPVTLSTNELRQLLPDWMDYEGVDLRTETISIAAVR